MLHQKALRREANFCNGMDSDYKQAVLCSCFIPGFSGYVPPKYHGVAYVDGGMSNNVLVLDEDTVTVCPFSGESDICPREAFNPSVTVNVLNTSFAITPGNVMRLAAVLFPTDPERMSILCQQGFNDALRFLLRNKLITCYRPRCLATIQSNFAVRNSEAISVNDDEIADNEHCEHVSAGNCDDCKQRREIASLMRDPLPSCVADALHEIREQIEGGLTKWLQGLAVYRVMSYMSIAVVLPMDFVTVRATKILNQIPWMDLGMEWGNRLFKSLAFVTPEAEKPKKSYAARFSCQMSVREFNSVTVDDGKNSEDELKQLPVMRKKARVNLARSKTFDGALNRKTADQVRSGLQRKSYAGSEEILSRTERRRSLATPSLSHTPERLISSVNLEYTVNLPRKPSKEASVAAPSQSTVEPVNEAAPDVIETMKLFKSDAEEEVTALGMTTHVFNMQKEHRRKTSVHTDAEPLQHANSVENIIASSSRTDAVLSYLYKDSNNTVKMTELYAIPDEEMIQEMTQ